MKSTPMKSQVDRLKSQAANLIGVLMERKSQLIGKYSIFAPPRTISSTFSKLPSFVELDEEVDEFFVAVLPSTKKSKGKSGGNSAKTIAVNNAIEKITGTLRNMSDYSPIFLSDEDMGITEDAFLREGGTVDLSAADRAHYRYAFKKQLCQGLKSLYINVFGRMKSGGNSPSCIVVWKVPLAIGDNHAGKVQRAMDQSRHLIPKKIKSEAAHRLNNMLRGISSIPRAVRKAMANYLFTGEVNIKGNMAESYCRFVEHLSSGLPVDENWIVDGRKYNSNGGKGIGFTQFEAFWEECRR